MQVWDGYLQYAGRYGYLMMLVTIRLSSVAWRRPGLSGWGGPGGRFGVCLGGGLLGGELMLVGAVGVHDPDSVVPVVVGDLGAVG